MTQCIDAVNDRDEKTSASVSQLSSTQPNVEPAPTDELRHTIGESKSPNDENEHGNVYYDKPRSRSRQYHS